VFAEPPETVDVAVDGSPNPSIESLWLGGSGRRLDCPSALGPDGATRRDRRPRVTRGGVGP
jgi:hypothetical protein